MHLGYVPACGCSWCPSSTPRWQAGRSSTSVTWGRYWLKRDHSVEVVTIAADGPGGTSLDGSVPVHRIRTTAQHLSGLYSDPARPHAMPIADPGFRDAIERLLAAGHFDIVHAHDWSIGSAIGPARRAG